MKTGKSIKMSLENQAQLYWMTHNIIPFNIYSKMCMQLGNSINIFNEDMQLKLFIELGYNENR